MNFKVLLVLILILFIGSNVVTAADVNDSTNDIYLQKTSDIKSTVNPVITEEIDETSIKDNENNNEKIITDTQEYISTTKKKIDKVENNIKKSSQSIFKISDNTWDTYFSGNGSVNSDIVSEGDVLAFEGEFNDRFMMITVPVNITSGDSPAYLTNCLLYVYADNTNITGLNINNTDYDESVIYLDTVSNIIIENNTIYCSNYDEGMTTHTLEIDDSNNVIIKNNEIYTVGPEEDMNHDTGVIITASVNARYSNNITINSNYISTEDNGNYQLYGTIYGVYIRGKNVNEKSTGGRIINNTIINKGNYYMYTVTMSFAEEFIIENNNITTISGEYANGIQIEVVNQGVVRNNRVYTYANNFTYPIYCAGREGKNMIFCTDIIVSENTLYAESMTTYLIEFFIAQNNTVTYNNLSANVSYGTGIGTGQTANNLYEYNNINMTFNMNGFINNADNIPDSPTGITITTIKAELGVNNTIRYNNITVHSPETKSIPAIHLISTNNSVYRNYLISSQGISDDAVKYTEPNNVSNNYPVELKNITIPLNDIIMDPNQSESILITVFDEENNEISEGRIEIYIDDELQEEYTLTDYYIIYNIENVNVGTHYLTVKYISLNDMMYNNATNSSTITVNKIDTVITYETIEHIKYKDNVTITGILCEEDGKAINDTEINLYLNTKQFKVRSDDDGTFRLTAVVTSPGINNVTYSFEGNEYYNGYEISTIFNVEKQDINITYSIDNSRYKDNVTITGKIMDINGKGLYNINALITINNKVYKAKTDKTGAFTLTTITNTVGINNVSLAYNGNDYYNKYETNTTFNVEKQDITITYDKIKNTRYKDTVTITGKITDIKGNGLNNINALITINNKLYKAKTEKTGAFTLTTTATKIGSNDVTLAYNGNNYYNSYNTSTTFNVEKQDIIINYDTIHDVKYKENITITGKVSDVTGKSLKNINVLIHINGKLYKTKTDKTGAFTLTTTATKIGTCNVTLSYAGNANYNGYECNTTFNVEKQNVTITCNPIRDTVCGENVTITGGVTDVTGKAIYNINVLIHINGKLYKAKTDTTGNYTLSAITSKTGINNVNLSYGGNANYNSYQTSTTFNVIAKT